MDSWLPPVGGPWGQVEHVIVSGEIDQWGPKTIVIGAEAEGTAVTPDLPGSFDGAVDHVRALERAGYTLTS